MESQLKEKSEISESFNYTRINFRCRKSNLIIFVLKFTRFIFFPSSCRYALLNVCFFRALITTFSIGLWGCSVHSGWLGVSSTSRRGCQHFLPGRLFAQSFSSEPFLGIVLIKLNFEANLKASEICNIVFIFLCGQCMKTETLIFSSLVTTFLVTKSIDS